MTLTKKSSSWKKPPLCLDKFNDLLKRFEPKNYNDNNHQFEEKNNEYFHKTNLQPHIYFKPLIEL